MTDAYYKDKLMQRTENLTKEAVELVKNRFEKYEYGLLSTRGALLITEDSNTSRQKFERYITSLNMSKDFPGARGFGFIRRVAIGQENDFVATARADGAPDFKIRMLNAHNKDRFIIQYIYPEQNNKQAIGLDIGSESNRRSAALTAAISGEATLTAPITLVQAEGKARRGFLILLPVYSALVTDSLAEKRLDSTIGWAYAPLIVDDVLFDIGSILSEVDLTITDKAETIPFYKSIYQQNKANDVTDSMTSREIEFMGRNWIVSAKAHEHVEKGLLSYSPIWFLFLFLLMTSLSYFIAVILATKSTAKSISDDQQLNTSVRVFLASRSFISVIKGYIFIVLSILAFSGYLYVEQEFNVASKLLIGHAQYSKELIDNHEQNYKEGLIFIKSIPVISALTDSNNEAGGLPFQLDAWEGVLADIFKAYMQSQPEMYQIRLISGQGDGKELVRVERKGGEIFITPESELQNKGDSAYFANTIKLNNGEIHTSSIEPNIEDGEMELPIRLTRRYSTPLFNSDGSIFAIIVINVEVSPLLNEIRRLSSKDEIIYIINDQQKFLLAADQSVINDSFSEKNYQWTDVFQRSSNIFGTLNHDISSWEGDNGQFVSAEARVSPNQGEVIGQLKINATKLTGIIYKDAMILLLKQMLILLAFSILGLLLFYYSWANNTRMLIANRAQKELATQKQKDTMFESLTELSPEAMVIIDTSGVIVLINSQAEKLFGYRREQLVGQKINMLVPISVAHKHDSYVDGYVKNPRTRAMGATKDLFSRHADGSEFPVEVSLSPIQLDDKMLIASSIRNISERKTTENTLKKAIDKAKSASQAKTAFLANMSHEIRTPLNAVIGLTHLLQGNELTSEQLNLVNNIQLAGRSLLGIVNDILDLSKIEANEMTVVQAPCNLQQLLDEIYNVFLNQAEQKQISLNLEIDPHLAILVKTDKNLLKQILTNLLSNAIKFTSEGSVTLKVSCDISDGLSSSTQLVRFSIEDTGIGISPGQQMKIFQPFNQADEGINRRFDGTGLGLSIVNDLSELLGGEIGVSSELGKGSCFWLDLPLKQISKEEDFSSDSIVEPINIWVFSRIDNDECMLQKLCNSLGWRVFCGSNVTQFSQEFQQRLQEQTQLPDVMVIDWDLNGLDSLALIEMIFKIPHWQQIPVICICSEQQKANIEALDHSRRIKGVLFKPVEATELFSLVNNTLIEYTGDTNRVLESTKMEAIKAKWLPGVRILVVDDSLMNLDVVEKILTKNGASVTTACSGTEAIEALKHAKDYYDVVLMDVQMPVMDGLQATAFIRQQLNINTLPIIALTAGTLEEEKKRALDVGMNAFLSKPIEPAKLILSLRKHVEHYRERAIMIDHIEVLDGHEHAADWPDIIGITNSIDLFQGDLDLFEFSLRRLFEEHNDLDSVVANKLNVSEQEYRHLLATKIHKLRGSAGMVGAKELYSMASQAEISLRKVKQEEQKDLLSDIVDSLKALQKNSVQFLDEQVKIKEKLKNSSDSQAEKMDKLAFEQLILALENNDLSATDTVENHALNITALIGEEAFSEFNHQVEVLNYAKAADILKGYS